VLAAAPGVYDYVEDSCDNQLQSTHELLLAARERFDTVLNEFHVKEADPGLVLWGMVKSMQGFLAQSFPEELNKKIATGQEAENLIPF